MSRRLQHEARKTALLFVAVLLAFVCALLVCAPGPAWAANDAATFAAKVRVFQEYRVPVSGLENKFTYLIVPNENDAPLPLDESGNAFDSFTLTRDEDSWLEFAVPVAVSPSAKAYAYHYTLKPATDELEDGLHYVDVQSTSLDAGVNVYYLELYVQPSSEDAASAIVTPLVHVDGWDGPKVSDPGWRIEHSIDSESAATKSTATSSSALAKTDDSLTPWLATACIACAAAFLLVCTCLFRRKTGEDDA